MRRFRFGAGGRGFLLVLGGTAGAQLIGVLALPVLSRLYSPAAFGFLSLVLAIAAVVAPSATLRFETAAMLPTLDTQVRALAWNALLASFVASILTGVLLQVADWAGFADFSAFASLPYWVAFIVLLTGAYSVLSQLVLRKQQYGLVSRRAFARSATTVIAQGAFGAWTKMPEGLVLGAVVGNLVGISSMYRATRDLLSFPGWREVLSVWKPYWRFPAVFAPSLLLNSLGLQAPLIFFVMWFGVSTGGQLGMADRIVGVPLAVIGVAVSQVLDAEVAKQLRDGVGGLRRIYRRLSAGLIVIAAAVSVTFGALGGWAIPWILGKQWELAGLLVQVLAITCAVRLVASPLSRFLVLMQRSSANLILDVVRVVAMLASMAAVMAFDLGLVAAVWVVYSSLTLTYVLTWVWGYAAVKDR